MLTMRRCAWLALVLASLDAGAFTTRLDQNFGSDPIEVDVTVNQQGNNLKFTLEVITDNTGNLADLRGFFFDVADESLLGGLSVFGPDVTGQQFSANSVSNLGGGNSIGPGGPFDAGVAIGTAGIGGDDIQTTMFTLTHLSVALDVNNFFRASTGPGDFIMAARGTSVGPVGNRGGSAKVGGVGDIRPPPKVPEPPTAALAALALFWVARRRAGAAA